MTRNHSRCVIGTFVSVAAVAALSFFPALAAYHEEVLDNGLRVILIEHHANPMVNSAVIVRAGLIDESESTNGASHFLEHLLFNGTETRTQRELYDDVDRLGAYNNATTREDHTLFTLLVQKEFVGEGLSIQADMLFHSTLPEDKFEKEKKIVQEEIARSRADTSYLAELEFRAFAYVGTPLARPVLGTTASIEAMKRDDVWRYYKTRYVPSNMTLVVMGDFEAPDMLAVVKKIFGATEGRGAPATDPGTWPRTPESNLRTLPLEAGRTYLKVGMPLGLASQDPLMPAIELLVSALADGKDAPLDAALTSAGDATVLSFSLGVAHRVEPWATLEFDAAIPTGADPAAVLDELQRGLRSLGPGSAARDRIDALRDAARAAEFLLVDKIHYYAMMRSAYLVDAPEGYLAARAEIFDAIDDHALDLASERLRQALSGARVIVAGSDATEGRSSWKPERDELSAASTETPVVVTTLANGIQVGFERNDDSQVFALHLMFRPRSASEPEGRQGMADFLHRALLRGTRVRDKAALDASFTALGATVKAFDNPWVPYDDYYTTAEFSYLRLEMPSERWEEGLRLLGETVIHPRLANDDVEAVRTEMQDIRRRRDESPRSTASEMLRVLLAPGNPLAEPVPGTPDSLAAITPEEIRAFHQAYVTGNRMILTGIGPVDPRRFVRAAVAVFGTLPPGDEAPTPPAPPLTDPGLEDGRDDGREQAYLALGYLFDAEPDDRAALAVAGALLSDRLSFELREEQGLAYSMGASISPWGGRTRLSISMGTRPDNITPALDGLRTGLGAFRELEPDEDAVTKAANALRGRLLMRRMTSVNRAYFAGLALADGKSLEDDRSNLDALLGVTPEDVRRVIMNYIDPDRLAVVTVR